MLVFFQDNNSDDRSSTTPSPSEEFKEPDPLISIKGKPSNITRSDSSSTTSFSSLEKESNDTDIKPNIKIENTLTVDSENTEDKQTDESKEEPIKTDEIADKTCDATLVKLEDKEEETEPKESQDMDKQDSNNPNEFVEVADKSTDTSTVTTTTFPCTKHSVITMAAVVPASEVPEVADTQEVWETVLDSGCVTSAALSETKMSVAGGERQEGQDGSKGVNDEGQQVLITTSSINQLGIEVEDISENEEDIDPGQG